MSQWRKWYWTQFIIVHYFFVIFLLLGLKLYCIVFFHFVTMLCKHKGVWYTQSKDAIVVPVTQIVVSSNTYHCGYLGAHVNTAEFHMICQLL